MAKERKLPVLSMSYSRHNVIHGNQALWMGEPAENGARFRNIVMSSETFDANSTQAAFQVYAFEGMGEGIKNSKLSISSEASLLFDRDFCGFEAANKMFDQLVAEAQKQGFRKASFTDELRFRSKTEELNEALGPQVT
jgi:hypothetical protein